MLFFRWFVIAYAKQINQISLTFIFSVIVCGYLMKYCNNKRLITNNITISCECVCVCSSRKNCCVGRMVFFNQSNFTCKFGSYEEFLYNDQYNIIQGQIWVAFKVPHFWYNRNMNSEQRMNDTATRFIKTSLYLNQHLNTIRNNTNWWKRLSK